MVSSMKNRDVIISTYSLSVSTNLFQSGFQSKQISCVWQVTLLKADINRSYRLLISASEDTTVRFSVISHSDALCTIAVLMSHVSSVRALAVDR